MHGLLTGSALDLLAPVHGRAVGVLLADEAVHEVLVFLGQVLKDHAVRFDGLEVPGRHRRQGVPDLGDRDVLRGHDEVVHRPAGYVGQELPHIDVVPVHGARGVHEELAVLAATAVELVVAGAHRVTLLGVVLLALGPRPLHSLQGLGHGLLVHVRRLHKQFLEVMIFLR